MVRLWRRFQLKENPHISIRSVCVHVEILILFPQRHSLGNKTARFTDWKFMFPFWSCVSMHVLQRCGPDWSAHPKTKLLQTTNKCCNSFPWQSVKNDRLVVVGCLAGAIVFFWCMCMFVKLVDLHHKTAILGIKTILVHQLRVVAIFYKAKLVQNWFK